MTALTISMPRDGEKQREKVQRDKTTQHVRCGAYLVFSEMRPRVAHPNKYSGSDPRAHMAAFVQMRKMLGSVLRADQQREVGWSLRQQPPVNEKTDERWRITRETGAQLWDEH